MIDSMNHGSSVSLRVGFCFSCIPLRCGIMPALSEPLKVENAPFRHDVALIRHDASAVTA